MYRLSGETRILMFAVALSCDAGLCPAQDAVMQRQFEPTIRPLLATYCFACHSDELAEGDVNLSAFHTAADVREQPAVWVKVRQMLDTWQMPPSDEPQPTDEQRKQLRQWVHNELAFVARQHAGDPGPVVLRRLTNAEYNYTIRDLTGIAALDPTHEFPVDGAAGEGFTNVGAGQGMSPALLQKYLDAAKLVAEHVVLLPAGIRFSEKTTRRDQTDDLLGQIQSRYRQYTTAGGGTTVNFDGKELKTNVGGRLPIEAYLLATVIGRDGLRHGTTDLDAVAAQRGLSAKYLRTLWNVLNEQNPQPSPLLDEIRSQWRNATAADVPSLVERIGQWQSRLWTFNSVGQLVRAGGRTNWMEPVELAGGTQTTLLDELLGPEFDGAGSVTAIDEFRQLFPPALCYERIVPVDEVVTLTLFHREDEHLKRLMLDEAEAAELDRLWDELTFVSQEPLKLVVAHEQISEFATQDRPDLAEPFAASRQPILDRATAFRERMMAAEPSHVDAVIELAGRAWRTQLMESDTLKLRTAYQRLRESEIPHDEAVRLLLARVLTAPAFLYKLEHPAVGGQAAPVTSLELATRLSYFLWSSLPDAELREVSERGQLADDDVLIAQTKRMLEDRRTRRLAIHFACQWLHVRDFDEQNDKNEQLYPEFAALREPMYEETVRFFADLFAGDGSILDILNADHTFVNQLLAEHYGIDGVTDDEWHRVETLRESGRGGILGMATVLASQSGASRTSPILRGNWVSETLLGERLPKPPAGVPQLPETVPDKLTARQLTERHSSAPECAKCHQRIDPYGFALEQFDTIGRRRNQQVDTQTVLFDGKPIDGLDGLRNYLLNERRHDFVRQFCRKLLGYALGREVQLSDEPFLDELLDTLKANDYRFRVAVESIVTSRQFRDIRGRQAD